MPISPSAISGPRCCLRTTFPRWRNPAVHIAIFTNDETEKMLRSEPLFRRLEDYATVRFVHYPRSHRLWASMEARYGNETVHYSEHSLAFYYERNCKFALMSCAHYVGAGSRPGGRCARELHGRRRDGERWRSADHGGQTGGGRRRAGSCHPDAWQGSSADHGSTVPSDDGVLTFPSDDCARLIVAYMPAIILPAPGGIRSTASHLAWHVGEDGMLVHGNHYHPFCLRPKALTIPCTCRSTRSTAGSSIAYRSSTDRIHLVQDSSIIGLSIDDDPIFQQQRTGQGGPLVPPFCALVVGILELRLRLDCFARRCALDLPTRPGVETRGGGGLGPRRGHRGGSRAAGKPVCPTVMAFGASVRRS